MGTYGDLYYCRRKYLLNYFDEEAPDYCGNCDVCLTRLETFDGTVIAQKALSAVARLNERVGMLYVIDFLRGSKSDKIKDEHKQLKTFGVGRDHSKEAWKGFLLDLVQRGYLIKTNGMYPVLNLTEKSKVVLKGDATVMLTKSKEHLDVMTDGVENYDTDLFQKLKEVRRDLANSENVAAYIVLSDATLIELATYLPHNKDEFRQISGFGDIKIEKYGKHFWEVIATYCQEHELGSRIHLKSPKRQRKTKQEAASDTQRQTLGLFRLGHAISHIAETRNLTIGTIETHLAFFVQQGELSIDQIISSEKVALIENALGTNSGPGITRVKQQLGDVCSYGEIRLVIAHREFLKEHTGLAHSER